MENLLVETISYLEKYNKSLDDIYWIGGKDYLISKEEFIQKADQLYSSGFGGVEVRPDLILVGKDFWIERHSYDGSEWWEFKTLPTPPIIIRKINNIIDWKDEDLENGIEIY